MVYIYVRVYLKIDFCRLLFSSSDSFLIPICLTYFACIILFSLVGRIMDLAGLPTIFILILHSLSR